MKGWVRYEGLHGYGWLRVADVSRVALNQRGVDQDATWGVEVAVLRTVWTLAVLFNTEDAALEWVTETFQEAA